MLWNNELTEPIVLVSPIIPSEMPYNPEYDESEGKFSKLKKKAKLNAKQSEFSHFHNSKPVILPSEFKSIAVSKGTRETY